MLRNSTHKFKQTYQKDVVRYSTPVKTHPYAYPPYSRKPALKTETSLRPIKVDPWADKQPEASPYTSRKDKYLQLTAKTTN